MTDIETKALALVNDIGREAKWNTSLTQVSREHDIVTEALCRAIEQHEAFRQEVSDAVKAFWPTKLPPGQFARFIIAKPDPLIEIMAEVNDMNDAKAAEQLREALAKRGGKIVWENDQ